MSSPVPRGRRVIESPVYFAALTVLTVLLAVSAAGLWTHRPHHAIDLIGGSLTGWASLAAAGATIRLVRKRRDKHRPAPAAPAADD